MLIVSLFTREWIEIERWGLLVNVPAVSLFTREWIEITGTVDYQHTSRVSLFTREWIEMNRYCKPAPAVRLPLYEGVD